MCDGCAANMRIRAKNKRQEAGVNWPRGGNGFCWLCNKRKAIEGKRLCQTCYDSRCAALTPEAGAKGRQTQRERKGMRL